MAQSDGRINFGISLDNSQLRSDANESQRILRDLGKSAKAEGESIESSMKKIGASVAGLFAVDKLKDFTVKVASVRGEFQQLESAFNTMLGSKAKADALMSQLAQTAAKTPFSMTDVANGAKQLLAYGMEAEEVNDTLTRLGDIASGLSIPLNDLSYLYGTTMVQGRLYTQDLNQFLGRGIPLTAELAKQFGVAESEVKDLVSAGKVGFQDVEQAIKALTDEGGKFGGQMEKASESITGKISTLNDSIDTMCNEIGQMTEGVMYDAVAIADALVKNWEKVAKAIAVVIATLGTYKAALIVTASYHKMLAVVSLTQQFLSLSKGLGVATAAMRVFNLVTKANPIGFIVSAVVAAASAFALFSDKADDATDAMKRDAEEAQNFSKNMAEGSAKAQASYRSLQMEFKRLKDEHEKADWVKNAKSRFEELGIAVQSVTDAENVFVRNSAEVVSALKKRAEASAYQARVESTFAAKEEKRAELEAGRSRYKAGEKVKLSEVYDLVNGGKRRFTDVRDLLGSKGSYHTWNEEGAKRALEEYNKRMADELAEYDKKIDEYANKVIELTDESKALMANAGVRHLSEEEKKKKKKEDDDASARLRAVREYNRKLVEEEEASAIELRRRKAKLMNDGANKELELIEINYERLNAENKKRERVMVEALADARTNAWKAVNKGKSSEEEQKFKESLLFGKDKLGRDDLSETQRQVLEQYDQINKEIRANELKNVFSHDSDAMRAYLEKYGEFNLQKLAIAEKYAKLIKEVEESTDTDTQKAWRIGALNQERKKEEDGVESQAIMRKFDWVQAFDGLGAMLKKELRPLFEDLSKLTRTDAFRNLKLDEQKQVFDVLKNLREELGTNGDFGFKKLAEDLNAFHEAQRNLLEKQMEHEKLLADSTKDLNDLKKKINKAKKEGNVNEVNALNDALSALELKLVESGRAVTEAEELVKASGLTLSETATAVANPMSEIGTFLNSANIGRLSELWNAIEKLKGGFQAMSGLAEKAQKVDAAGAVEEAAKKSGSAMLEGARKVVGALQQGLSNAGFIGQIISAILSIVEILKDGVFTLIGSVIDMVNNSAEGSINALLGGSDFSNFGNSIADTFRKPSKAVLDNVAGWVGLDYMKGGFYNIQSNLVNQRVAKREAENKWLSKKVENMLGKIDDSYGAESLGAYLDAIQAQEQKMKNDWKNLLDKQDYSGAHHSNSSYWGISSERTNKVNELLGTNIRGGNFSDWAELTAEQMDKIRTELPEIWADMLSEGKYDNSKYFEAYADDAGKIKELTDKIRETLLNTDFKGMRDGFIDSLMDMEKSAEDFSNDFSEMMHRSLLQAAISQQYDPIIQKFYEDITDAMGVSDGVYHELSSEELDGFRKRYMDLVSGMMEVNERISGLTGDIASTEQERSPSQKGIATASQDSVDELNGRATAIQGHTYSICENTKLLLSVTGDILKSVINIEHNTDSLPDRLAGVESNLKAVKETVNDIAVKGIKVR